MCLEVVVEVAAEDRDKLEAAAVRAAEAGLHVRVSHARWRWARSGPTQAFVSEEGGCGCSLLGDEADWNAEVWDMRNDLLDRFSRTLEILSSEGPERITVQARWGWDKPRETVRVTTAELRDLALKSRLGTRTRYEVYRNAG